MPTQYSLLPYIDKTVDFIRFYANNVEISRTIPKRFQNFVIICYKIRCTMTQTDVVLVDGSYVRGKVDVWRKQLRSLSEEQKRFYDSFAVR